METQVIFIYCLADTIVKTLNLKEDPQSKMSLAEIIAFVMISALFYQGNYKNTHMAVLSCRYFSKILSHSRMIRRIHQIHKSTWVIIFSICRNFIHDETSKDYIIDSFPVAVCQNYKQFRCKLFPGKNFHGYTASKKQYFFGIKVHMIVSSKGVPIEFVFSPGSEADIRGLRRLEIDLPLGSCLFADAAYTDYSLEDFLSSEKEIRLISKRRKGIKRTHSLYNQLKLSITRNRIETVFSGITALMPRTIRAKTEKGFCLKVMFFILAYTVKLSLAK